MVNNNSGFTAQEMQFVKLNLKHISDVLNETVKNLSDVVEELDDFIENTESAISEIQTDLGTKLSAWHDYENGTTEAGVEKIIIFDKPIYSFVVKCETSDINYFAVFNEISQDFTINITNNDADTFGVLGPAVAYNGSNPGATHSYMLVFLGHSIKQITFLTTSDNAYSIKVID